MIKGTEITTAQAATGINSNLRDLARKQKEKKDETFFLSDELVEQIQKDAEIEGRSVTGQIAAILETLYGPNKPGVGKNVRELFFQNAGTVLNGRHVSLSELTSDPTLWDKAQSEPARAELMPPCVTAKMAA